MFETEEEEGPRGVLKVEVERGQLEKTVHSQVRKIKWRTRRQGRLLLRLQLLEMRPPTGFRELVARQASPSPLRRSG
jgi:hypothetical protein